MSCLLYVLRHVGWFVLRMVGIGILTFNLGHVVGSALVWLFGNSTTGGL